MSDSSTTTMPAKSVYFTQDNYIFISQRLIHGNWSETVNDILDAYRTKQETVENMINLELFRKLKSYMDRENERRMKKRSTVLSFSEFLNQAVREKLDRELAKELYLS